MVLQLFSQESGSLTILVLTCNLVQKQEHLAAVDVVEIEVFSLVSANASVCIDEVVHSLLNETEVTTIAGAEPNAFDSFQHHALFVAPPRRLTVFIFRGVAPKRVHSSGGDLLGQRWLLSVQTCC